MSIRIAFCTALLVCLGTTRAETQTAQASFDLQLAESKHERAKSELKLSEEEFNQAAKKAEKARQLFAKGLISRREVESAEQETNLARARHQAALDVETATGELVKRAREYLEKTIEYEKELQDLRLSVARVSRSYGRGAWTVGDLTLLARDFKQQFDADLPITAFGQTHVHDRLGLNHEGRVDIGLHPESEQGQWVIEFLKKREIPYIAFTAEVPGSATGAHIHIGLPSGRK
jgi:Skp family chaperone for outer membrane proteins